MNTFLHPITEHTSDNFKRYNYSNSFCSLRLNLKRSLKSA